VTFEKAGSASETISQLFISYFYTHVIRRIFGKIPVVRTLLHWVMVPLMNILAIFFNILLPKGPDLYMNNVVVAVKK
jgi:hypothetical protein